MKPISKVLLETAEELKEWMSKCCEPHIRERMQRRIDELTSRSKDVYANHIDHLNH